MRERKGHIFGIVFLLLCIVAVLPGQYARWAEDWRADREWGRAADQRMEDQKLALAAIGDASPDPLARLEAHGVALTYEASSQGETLEVEYTLAGQAPVAEVYPLFGAIAPSPRLLDRESGKQVGYARESGSGSNPGGPTSGHIRFERVSAIPLEPAVEFPPLAVYIEPDRPLRWEVRRAGEEAAAPVGQRFAVAGVEFEVEQVRFAGRQVHVDYRQVTNSSSSGFYVLTFRLRDGLGGNWESDRRVDDLPNPFRPTQTFEIIPWLSSTWTVEVAHAILVVPGPTIPLEVK
jgi:hypothetical protein